MNKYEAMNIPEKIRKVAKEFGHLINGRKKQQVIRQLYKITAPFTKKIYSDNSWAGVNKLIKTLRDQDIPVSIDDSKYEKEDDVLIRKRWFITIEYIDDKDRPQKLNSIITAAGAGSVKDPLDKYDLNIVF